MRTMTDPCPCCGEPLTWSPSKFECPCGFSIEDENGVIEPGMLAEVVGVLEL